MALSDRRRTGTLNAGRPVPPRDPQRGDRAGRAGRELLSHSRTPGRLPPQQGRERADRPSHPRTPALRCARQAARSESSTFGTEATASFPPTPQRPLEQGAVLPCGSQTNSAARSRKRCCVGPGIPDPGRAAGSIWSAVAGRPRGAALAGTRQARPRPGPRPETTRAHRPFRGFPFSFTLLFALAAVFHNLWMAFIRPSVRSCRCHGEGWRVALIWSLLPGRGSASLVPEFSPLTRLRRRAGDSPLGPVRALPP